MNNKRRHPSEIRNCLKGLLATSYINYVINDEDLEKIKGPLNGDNYRAYEHYFTLIDQYYDLTPIKDSNNSDFLWFKPDTLKYEELKRAVANIDISLFPGYKGFEDTFMNF